MIIQRSAILVLKDMYTCYRATVASIPYDTIGEALFIVCLISSIIKQNHVLDIGGYLHPLSIGITVPLSEEKNLGSKVIFSTKFNFLLFPFSKNEIKEHHSKHIS